MKPLCSVCNTRHEGYQAHVFATNTPATNKGIATNSATNTAGDKRVDKGAVEASRSVSSGVDESVNRQRDDGKSCNRRSREAYNRYQRNYMALKRTEAAVKSGRAEFIK